MKRVVMITGSVLLFVCRVNAQVPSEKDGKYSLQITTNNNGVKMHIDTTFNDLESLNLFLKKNKILLPEPPEPFAGMTPPIPSAPPVPPAPPLPPSGKVPLPPLPPPPPENGE
ncbi:MAG: hypothetical protein M9940_02180 [Bacteroidetes bacterium]|nr:hypothetical protein [Bacteroidetes bacterium CHB6]MCO5288209.1 hypothetical protein [Bacteroidota bacterium]